MHKKIISSLLFLTPFLLLADNFAYIQPYAVETNPQVQTTSIKAPLKKSTSKKQAVKTVQNSHKVAILFQHNSTILAPKYIQALNKFTNYLQADTSIQVVVYGYADANEMNRKSLAQARAKAVVQKLIKNGIQSTRLTAIGIDEHLLKDHTQPKNSQIDMLIIQ